MPCDTYAFEADVVDSRKLNMVGRKKSQEKKGLFFKKSFSIQYFAVHFCQRRTSPGTGI